jgi:pimeloyl-ACP methyl ester carboxylesterase
MSQTVERIFAVRGLRLAAKCWNDASLPPLLALHGWLDNANTWELLAPLLPDYHIVCLDFAGHGQSSHRPDHTRYHTLDHVDDVHAVVKQLGWEKFTLMGHSMGAGIATIFAGTFPELITKLVLIEGLGTYAGDPEQAPGILRNAVEQWAAYQDGTRLFADFEIAVRARQQGIGQVSAATARLLCERGVRAVEGGFTWTTDKRLKLDSTLRLDEAQVQAFIAAIAAPTLLIQAEQGLPFGQSRYAARLAALRGVAVAKLAGGHHLHVDGQAEAVAARVRQFLAGDAGQ